MNREGFQNDADSAMQATIVFSFFNLLGKDSTPIIKNALSKQGLICRLHFDVVQIAFFVDCFNIQDRRFVERVPFRFVWIQNFERGNWGVSRVCSHGVDEPVQSFNAAGTCKEPLKRKIVERRQMCLIAKSTP